MKTFVLSLTLALGALITVAARADCPPGSYLVSNPTNTYCLPNPDYRALQPSPNQQRTEVWQDRYGAIAIDGPNKATGSSVNMRSEAAARDAAIGDCKFKGGTACVVKLPFRNGCAVVVTGDNGHNASAHQTIADASSEALDVCAASGDSNCRVYYRVCSPPIRVQ